MLNNTLLFWAFFLTVYALYWFVTRTPRSKRALLLAANAVFYASWDLRLLWVPVLLCYINHRGAQAIRGAGDDDASRRRYLAITVAASVLLLIVFRYLEFLQDNLDALLALLGFDGSLAHLSIPPALGISFMTFAALSYTLDVYRGSYEAQPSFAKLLVSISFFPITVAGPITRPKELVPQLDQTVDIDWRDVRSALFLIAVGLFKKTIADVLGVLIADAYDSSAALDTATAWAAAIGYVAQLYADFSGYTDIAIGTALLLGIKIPINFRLPFLAASPVEIWRRWHITLSAWIRDYLFVSLGLRTPYRSLFLAWVIAGLWHGPSWTFFVWGVYQAVLIVITAFLTRRVRLGKKTLRRLYPARWLLTFYSWVIGCAIFRAPTLERAGDVLAAMHSWQGEFLYVTFATMVVAVAAIVIGHLLDAANFSGLPVKRGGLALGLWAVLIIVLLTFALVINPGALSFIYAGF
jgi:alginate O-acetyltransferase complex protein AlgI